MSVPIVSNKWFTVCVCMYVSVALVLGDWLELAQEKAFVCAFEGKFVRT